MRQPRRAQPLPHSDTRAELSAVVVPGHLHSTVFRIKSTALQGYCDLRFVTPDAAESKVLLPNYARHYARGWPGRVINAHEPLGAHDGALPCSHAPHKAAPVAQSLLVNAAPPLNSSDSGEPFSCSTHPAR